MILLIVTSIYMFFMTFWVTVTGHAFNVSIVDHINRPYCYKADVIMIALEVCFPT